MKNVLLLGWTLVLGILLTTQINYAYDTDLMGHKVVFESVDFPEITMELEEHSKLTMKEYGTSVLVLDLDKKGEEEDQGVDLYHYAIKGSSDYRFMTIVDMSHMSISERKQSLYKTESDAYILIKGHDDSNDLLMKVEIISGSFSKSPTKTNSKTYHDEAISTPEEVTESITNLFRRLDDDFKAETTGMAEFSQGNLSFFSLDESFLSSKKGKIVDVNSDYKSLSYDLVTVDVAQVLLILSGYSNSTYSVDNLNENPKHMVFVVKKNGSTIGFCDLRKDGDGYIFRLTEMMDISKFKTSITALWYQLEGSPTALKGTFKTGATYQSTKAAFGSNDATYMKDNTSHTVLNHYSFYAKEALAYLIKKANFGMLIRKKEVLRSGYSDYYEVHKSQSSKYVITVGQINGEAVVKTSVGK